jgi:prophage regulatory protein
MKLLNKKALREKTSLSLVHLARLEADGKFPRRVKLTDAPNGRVAWLESDIDAWIELRILLRDSK